MSKAGDVLWESTTQITSVIDAMSLAIEKGRIEDAVIHAQRLLALREVQHRAYMLAPDEERRAWMKNKTK